MKYKRFYKRIKENEIKINQYKIEIKNRVKALYGIISLHKEAAPTLNGFISNKNSTIPKFIKYYLEKYNSEIAEIKTRVKKIHATQENPYHNKAAKILEEIESIFKMYCNRDSNDSSKLAEHTKEFDTEIINVCTIMQEQNDKITKLEEAFQKNSQE